jgi:hypothetical protein
MKSRTKIVLSLIALCLVDSVIPVPIIGAILLYVLYEKPEWFREMVTDIYGT